MRAVRHWEVIQKDCHIWDLTFSPLFMSCPLLGMSAVGRFYCSQEQILYEVKNVNTVQYPLEVWKYIITRYGQLIFSMKHTDHDVKSSWRRQ